MYCLRYKQTCFFFFLFSFFFIQFNVSFKIISVIETSQSVSGAKREYPGKTNCHPQAELGLSHMKQTCNFNKSFKNT